MSLKLQSFKLTIGEINMVENIIQIMVHEKTKELDEYIMAIELDLDRL